MHISCIFDIFYTKKFNLVLTQVKCNLTFVDKKNRQASHTRYRALGPELIPVYWQSAHRWVIHPAVGCHYFPLGLRLPSQLQSITAPWPVPSYTAWWQRHIGVNNLSKVVTQLFWPDDHMPDTTVVNAYEGKAGMVYLQVKLCDPCLSALRYT